MISRCARGIFWSNALIFLSFSTVLNCFDDRVLACMAVGGAELYLARGDARSALREMAELAKKRSTSLAKSTMWRALALAGRDDVLAAQTLSELDDFELHMLHLQALINQKKLSTALPLIEELSKKFPQELSLLLLRISLYASLGDYKKAHEVIERHILVCGENRKDAQWLFLQSQLFEREKKYEQALKKLAQVLKIRPSFESALCARARIHEFLGNKSLALTDYLACRDLFGENQEFRKKIVCLLYEQGRYSEAQKFLQNNQNLHGELFDGAVLALKNGNLLAAKQYINKLRAKKIFNVVSYLLELKVLLLEKNTHAAINLLADMINRYKDRFEPYQAVIFAINEGLDADCILLMLKKLQIVNHFMFATRADIAARFKNTQELESLSKLCLEKIRNNKAKSIACYAWLYAAFIERNYDVLEHFFNRSKNMPAVFENLQACYLIETQRASQATAIMDLVTRANPRVAAYWDTLACSYQQQDAHKARHYFEEALRCDPNNRIIQDHWHKLG